MRDLNCSKVTHERVTWRNLCIRKRTHAFLGTQILDRNKNGCIVIENENILYDNAQKLDYKK